jgi:outer membrane protein OmpA-like peptidoglycan-associated protein
MRPRIDRLAGLALLLAAPAAAGAQLQDVKGRRDHPVVSRYAGSTVIGYQVRDFDEFVLPLGPIQRVEGPGITVEPSKSQRLEGRHTRILYVAPAERSPLEVLRNYEAELGKAGFQTLYACAGAACGGQDGWLGEHYLYGRGRELRDTPPPGAGAPPGQISEYAFNFPRDQRYLASRLARPEGDVYASVLVAVETFDHFPETRDHSLVLLDVVEVQPMDTGMVTVDAAAMAKDIAATGRVALYGILFDTDKADIRPESAKTLAEIAALLAADPELELYVVGHTDNVGGFDYNLRLSERRAAAVVRALTAEHGVAAARLEPAGVGLLSPVAPNGTEEGRARNRRVELVEQ